MSNIAIPKEIKERSKKLRQEIARHRYLYHVLDREEISAAALDSLKHELSRLEEKCPQLITPDSPTQRVAGKPLPGFKKVTHKARMTSLNDAFSFKELAEWQKRIQRILPRESIEYFAEIKVDGFAISLQYKNGMLASGSTRGDGITGENVTENLKTIESIPLRLHDIQNISEIPEVKKIMTDFPRVRRAVKRIPREVEIRGEVYMTKTAFAEINRSQKKKGLALFANPRNVAAGSIRQLDPRMAASRKLEFLAYDLISDLGQETHEEEHLIAKMFGFRTMELAEHCRDIGEVESFWKKVRSRREKLPFLIDGIVVQVNSGKLFERLGIAGKAPRGAVAYKFPAKEATTLVENIILQVGRTGVLTPVAVLKPVDVGGVTVSRATLHNMDEIERLDVRPGDTVVVRRAGDVIPDVVKVLINLRSAHVKKFRMPRSFCGQPVIRRKEEVAHRIAHPEKCGLVRREQFYHFTSKRAFDIQGLGPKIIDRLIDEGIAQDPADLFLLKEEDIAQIERFAEKSAENLIRALQSKKEIDLARFIFALGILHVGEETAIDLAKNFGTLEKIAVASREALQTIPDIGPVAAESVHGWFHEKRNQEFLRKLLRADVRPKSYNLFTLPNFQGKFGRARPATYKLRGLIFVITGGLETMTRDEAKEKIRQKGGNVAESVSKKTDYVVFGKDPGSKLEKAKKLRIKIIDEKKLTILLS